MSESNVRTIDDLRDVLFRQLDILEDTSKPVDYDRVRTIVAVSEQMINLSRLQVQVCAIMKGELDVPFIESSMPERPLRRSESLDPIQRLQNALRSGPAPDHPWRSS